MDLSVIVVNYNTSKELVNCINSVKENTSNLDYELIVIDNNSKSFPKISVDKLIMNNSNVGFARAVNQGIKNSSGNYILLLNPDTLLVEDSFRKMIDYLDNNLDVGVLGCKLINEDKSFQPSCHAFPNWIHIFTESSQINLIFPKNKFIINFLGMFKHLAPKTFASYDCPKSVKDVDNVMGSCFLMRKSALDITGLFDEKFFLYHEEMELSYRMNLKGFKVRYFPFTKVVHFNKRSSNNYKARVYFEKVRSMDYFLKKYSLAGKNWLLLGVALNLLFILPQFFRKGFRKLYKSRIDALRIVRR